VPDLRIVESLQMQEILELILILAAGTVLIILSGYMARGHIIAFILLAGMFMRIIISYEILAMHSAKKTEILLIEKKKREKRELYDRVYG